MISSSEVALAVPLDDPENAGLPSFWSKIMATNPENLFMLNTSPSTQRVRTRFLPIASSWLYSRSRRLTRSLFRNQQSALFRALSDSQMTFFTFHLCLPHQRPFPPTLCLSRPSSRLLLPKEERVVIPTPLEGPRVVPQLIDRKRRHIFFLHRDIRFPFLPLLSAMGKPLPS